MKCDYCADLANINGFTLTSGHSIFGRVHLSGQCREVVSVEYISGETTGTVEIGSQLKR